MNPESWFPRTSVEPVPISHPVTGDLLPPTLPDFAFSRAQALKRLEEFVPLAGRYSKYRNHVLPGHPWVSKLSPAVRHRLLLEEECCQAPLTRYAASTMEKFTQEVYWRRYWKAWMSLRPQVWRSYRTDLQHIQHHETFNEVRQRAERCMNGESSTDIMNYFAHELTTTGYLHNHARMWFAGWWVHVERLPWQLGADFFFRNLLDADPASNTLSWRWVAGIQTPGKTYLPRRANIEKYIDPEILETRQAGLRHLESPVAHRPECPPKEPVTRPRLEAGGRVEPGKIGLWIHEEDLLPEKGPLADLVPHTSMITGDFESWSALAYSEQKRAWLLSALRDTEARTKHFYKVDTHLAAEQPLSVSLSSWARQNDLRGVVTLRPEVGPLAGQLPSLREALAKGGVELVLFDRPEDTRVRSLATGGFFNFWKECQRDQEPASQ